MAMSGQRQGGMATRNRQNWKLDNQGEYARQVGWKHSRNGKLIQHKFRLGADLKEAKRREQKLLELWGQIEATTATPGLPIIWSPFTLDVAKQIAKGKVRSKSQGCPTIAPKPTPGISTVCSGIIRWFRL